eukprot:1393880-Amorphochlora_amoeboformis.AAC.1
MGLDGCGRLLCARDSSRIGQVPALVLGITLLVLVELNMDAAKIFGHSTEPHAPMAQVKPKEFEITVSQVAGTSDNSQSAKTSPSSDTSSTTKEVRYYLTGKLTPKTEIKTSEQTEKATQDQKSSEKAPLEDGKCPNDKPLCKLSVAILMTAVRADTRKTFETIYIRVGTRSSPVKCISIPGGRNRPQLSRIGHERRGRW